jgi:hypothetical protein
MIYGTRDNQSGSHAVQLGSLQDGAHWLTVVIHGDG